jgi:hypothetical protein
VDAVLVTSTAVIPIEFKVGAKKFQQADYEQAWDYGLGLKNIEAARSLYARHTVHDITRSDAGAVNLAVTSAAVERIIAQARERRRKAIVFVTGVPGAGKTLAGLNVATRHGSRDDPARRSASAFSRWSRCASRSRMYCMKPSMPPCFSSSCRRISRTSATIGSSAS